MFDKIYQQLNKTYRNVIFTILSLMLSFLIYWNVKNNQNKKMYQSQFYMFKSIYDVSNKTLHNKVFPMCISCEEYVNFLGLSDHKKPSSTVYKEDNSHVLHIICEIIKQDNLYTEIICLQFLLSFNEIFEGKNMDNLMQFFRKKINSYSMRKVLSILDFISYGSSDVVSDSQLSSGVFILSALANKENTLQDLSNIDQCIANI